MHAAIKAYGLPEGYFQEGSESEPDEAWVNPTGVREDLEGLPLALAVFIGSFDTKPLDRELHDQVIEWLKDEGPRFSTGGTVAEWRSIYNGRMANLKKKAVREAPIDTPSDIGDRMVISKRKKN